MTIRAHDGIAVVGASIAGVAAVDAIRDAGYAGPVHLIDAQHHQPYDRPPLSKQVLAAGGGSHWLREDAHWRRRGISLHLGTAVTALHAPSRTLTLADGEQVRCAAVVLAPGSTPRPLPFEVEQVPVHVLRTLTDAERIASLLDTARSLVVIGAGFVGLEVASAARQRGIDVTVVDVAAHPLAAVIGAPAADYLLDRHREAGTAFRLGATVRSVGAGTTGTSAAVRLGSGEELHADAVVAGIGVRPATDWLAGSGVELADGVVADAHLHCAEGIFAAGDAVSWPNPVYGRRMRVEHWTTAREQGATAGANAAAFALTGARGTEFAHVPYVWSDQCGRKAQFVGHLMPGTETVVDRRDEHGLVSSHYLAGRLIGRTTVSAPKDVMAARRQIQTDWRDLGPVVATARTPEPVATPEPAAARALEGALS